jgi:fructoselysine 6-kinase
VQQLPGATALCHVSHVNGDRVLGDYDEGVMAEFSLLPEDFRFLGACDLAVTGLWGHAEHSLEAIRAMGIPVAFDGAERPFDPAGRIALPHTDIAFFSDDALDDSSLKEKILAVSAAGPKLVIATRGAQGSLAYDGQCFVSCAPAPCALIDTMGAGDSFILQSGSFDPVSNQIKDGVVFMKDNGEFKKIASVKNGEPVMDENVA